MAVRSNAPLEAGVQIVTRGRVPARVMDYAVRKIGPVPTYTSQPVLAAHVVLELAADPGRSNRALAEASLDVNGTPVRAKVAANELHEAVDLLEQRLRRRLVELEDRRRTRGRERAAHEAHEWRHGERRPVRPPYTVLPADERQIIRRKTFALQPSSAQDAVQDMDLLGHDFYLFTEQAGGREALVHRRPDGRIGLRRARHPASDGDRPPEVVLESPAPTLTEAEAKETLDVSGEPFVFYADSLARRGHVLYRRYDGHYGLITPA